VLKPCLELQATDFGKPLLMLKATYFVISPVKIGSRKVRKCAPIRSHFQNCMGNMPCLDF
jgi:hypothetical protein